MAGRCSLFRHHQSAEDLKLKFHCVFISLLTNTCLQPSFSGVSCRSRTPDNHVSKQFRHADTESRMSWWTASMFATRTLTCSCFQGYLSDGRESRLQLSRCFSDCRSSGKFTTNSSFPRHLAMARNRGSWGLESLFSSVARTQ